MRTRASDRGRSVSILILRTGSTAPEVIARYGDYDRWFTAAISDRSRRGLGFRVCDITKEPMPDPSAFAGVIVTGSTKAAYRSEPWMDPVCSYLAEAERYATPVLCVCLGMQLLAQARGGRVILNPNGWEVGGACVTLTPAAAEDQLFAGLPARMMVLATHQDRVELLPRGAVLLASNDSTPVQAFRAANEVWGTQFHPEADTGILDLLIRLRENQLRRDAESHGLEPAGHLQRLFGTLADPRVAQGRRVLDRFVSLCVDRVHRHGTTPRSR